MHAHDVLGYFNVNFKMFENFAFTVSQMKNVLLLLHKVWSVAVQKVGRSDS